MLHRVWTSQCIRWGCLPLSCFLPLLPVTKAQPLPTLLVHCWDWWHFHSCSVNVFVFLFYVDSKSWKSTALIIGWLGKCHSLQRATTSFSADPVFWLVSFKKNVAAGISFSTLTHFWKPCYILVCYTFVPWLSYKIFLFMLQFVIAFLLLILREETRLSPHLINIFQLLTYAHLH